MQGFGGRRRSQTQLALEDIAATVVDVLGLGRLVEGLVTAHESLVLRGNRGAKNRFHGC